MLSQHYKTAFPRNQMHVFKGVAFRKPDNGVIGLSAAVIVLQIIKWGLMQGMHTV